MKLSYNWLKDYLKCDLSPEAVAEAMTSIGIEVDSVEQQEQIPGGLAGVVVVRIICISPGSVPERGNPLPSSAAPPTSPRDRRCCLHR